MEKLSTAVDSMPIDATLVQTAFETFREEGELPEHQRLAKAVIRRVRSGVEVVPLTGRHSMGSRPGRAEDIDIGALIRQAAKMPKIDPPPDAIRAHLYDEAIHESPVVHGPARLALRLLAQSGRNVTTPLYLDAEMGVPKYGTVGLHLLGFPECLAIPPYEEQAWRLLERIALMRERIPPSPEWWFRAYSGAMSGFLKDGGLPDDDLMCAVALAHGELFGLMAHYCRRGDAELLAAFEAAAQASGPQREAALRHLCALQARGREAR